MSSAPAIFYVVPNTHWDREHRHGFQETRVMLVETLDRVIDLLEADQDWRCFVMDGQFVAIEDYLEVRPGKRQRLQDLVAQGRFLIGPWYSLPDHYSVHPEAMVRNLLIGNRICQEFGGVFRFGYSIFSFGQPAQLPQIYAGFGIDTIIYYKMYPKHLLPKSEFFWKGPDGTTALCSRLGPYIRANFFFTFTIPVLLGGDPEKDGWEVQYNRGRKIFRAVGGAFSHANATELEQDICVRREELRASAQKAIDSATADTYQPGVMLGFEGNDFSRPVKELTEALRAANEEMGGQVEFRIGSPLEYFDEFRRMTDLSTLPTVEGEMRAGPLSRQHSEVLGTASRIILANARAEELLIHYAEPLHVLAMAGDGEAYPAELLRLAWKMLLKCQAHDTTHGVGVPKITRDALHHLEQVQELAETLARRGFERLARQLNTDDLEEGTVLLLAFNPLPRSLSPVLHLAIDLPGEEHVGEFHLETLDGTRVDHYKHGRRKRALASINHENRPKPLEIDSADLDLHLPDLPACGYTAFLLKRQIRKGGVDLFPFPDPTEPHSPIGRLPNVLENEQLRVQIAANGSITVEDKQSGHRVEGVGMLIDSGDVGDMWIHRRPCYNEHLSSYGAQARVALMRNSFLSGTFTVELELDLPVSANDAQTGRSEQRRRVLFRQEVTLRRGSRTVEFVTTFDNVVRDHYLTARFPSAISEGRIISEAAFETRQRPTEDPTSNNHGVRGPELRRFPMHRFVALEGQGRCCALFTKGLREFEPKRDGELIVDLSLVRSMKQTFPVHFGLFMEFEEEESQSQGPHRLEYAFHLQAGPYDPARLQEAADAYRFPPAIAQTGKGLDGKPGPLTRSLVQFPPASRLNLSCVKKAEDDDAIILRVNNPTEQPVEESLALAPFVKSVERMTLNETDGEALACFDGCLELAVKPYEIVTLRLAWKDIS